MSKVVFPYSSDNKRYHTLSWHNKRLYGTRAIKIPVNIGATCPNRDGTKGVGGCKFCSGLGSGEFAGKAGESLQLQFEAGKARLKNKWPDGCYIIYFQNFTNTWLPTTQLKNWVEAALSLPGVKGIAIATRADCISIETAEYLGSVAKRCNITIELGLQTIHDKTAAAMNRCHSYNDFLDGYNLCVKYGLNVCVHLLNGLPGESKEMMIASAKAIGGLRPHSIKIHMLCVLKNTALAAEYAQSPFPLLSLEDYVDILHEQLKVIPAETVIERITGDPLKDDLIAPQWVLNKLKVRNLLDTIMAQSNTIQGMLA